MSDSWKIKIFGKGTTYPFVLIDNWFLPHEEEAVWSEIDFYLRNAFIFKSAGSEEDSVARNPDKTSKAQNKRLFLDDLYKNRGASHIINCSYKQRQPFFKKLLEENCQPYYRSLSQTNTDRTMLTVYGDGDHYNTHFDATVWTCLIWLVQEPKFFDGGDFEFTDINEVIELKNNRMVIFPSCFNHKVYPLKYHDKDDHRVGKFTITHFYSRIPQDVYHLTNPDLPTKVDNNNSNSIINNNITN